MLSNSSSQRSGANQIILNGVAKEKGFMAITPWRTLRNAWKSEYIADYIKVQTADSYRLLFWSK